MKLRILILCLIFAISTGCGIKQTISEYIGGGDNTIPPSPLINFTETAKLNKVWLQNTGKGTDDSFTNITPTILDEQIFIADPKGNIAALTIKSGDFVWRNDSRLSITGGPGAGSSLVLVGTSEGEILALSRNTGSEAWRTKVSSEVLSSPREADGVVVVRTIDGKHLWIYDRSVPTLSLRGTSSPVIANGLIITGFDDGRLAVIELKTGKLVWEKKVAFSRGRNELERMVDIDAQPLVIEKIIYVTTFQANVSAISLETGQILWQREISSHSELSADKKNIFLTEDNGSVWALNRFTGASVWKQEKLANRKVTGPAILGDKVIVCDAEGYMHWLDKETGDFAVRTRIGDNPILTQPINSNDILFVYSSSGALSAYTYKNIEEKYITKELENKKSVPEETISADKKTAYERSRRVSIEKNSNKEIIENTEKESENEDSLFGRFLNIFSDDSEEDVE